MASRSLCACVVSTQLLNRSNKAKVHYFLSKADDIATEQERLKVVSQLSQSLSRVVADGTRPAPALLCSALSLSCRLVCVSARVPGQAGHLCPLLPLSCTAPRQQPVLRRARARSQDHLPAKGGHRSIRECFLLRLLGWFCSLLICSALLSSDGCQEFDRQQLAISDEKKDKDFNQIRVSE